MRYYLVRFPSAEANAVKAAAPPKSWRDFGLLLGGILALALTGCHDDEIRTYQVPRAESAAPSPASAETGKYRMIAAIFPRSDRTWFFKLTGPTPVVTANEAAVQQFLHSIRFIGRDDPPITWTLPEGWTRLPGGELRYATLRLGPADAPLELTVHTFEGRAGSVPDNINRWRRRELSLPEASRLELARATRRETINGAAATLVDMTGPGPAPNSGAMR
jgi:hypothetical protein